MIEITIPGEVMAKGRPRFSRKGGGVRTYTPAKTMNYERKVKMYALQHKPKEMFTDAIDVSIIIHRKPPNSWSNIKKQRAINGEIKPTTKPDIDNNAKALLDAMIGIIFKDDNLITKLSITKKYAEVNQAIVTIKEAD